MTGSAYVPASDGWMFLTNGHFSVGVALPDESPLLGELWKLVISSSDAGPVLDVLTRSGISSAPHFLIVTLGSEGKVLVRGPVTVSVEGSESGTITGSGFSSWAERRFDRLDRFECEIVPPSDSVRVPIQSGAIRAGWFAADTNGIAAFGKNSAPTGVDLPAPVLIARPSDPEPAKQHAVPTAPPAAETHASQVSSPNEPMGEETVAGPLGEDDELADEVDGSAPTPATSAYDFLFGETSYRTVEDAAVRPTEEQDDTASAPLEEHTVVASDLAKLRADRRAGRGRAVELPAPKVKFYVELSTGGRELLDQPLVIGRAPSASALGGGSIPRLITMTTVNQDISRTHARIAVEGETVVVTDLHSRNGTLVTMPGRPAQKLREGEPTVIIPGTIVDLGDGATLTVQEG
ncbi:hypothetical protein ABIB54_003320 [Frigoribacterium sp. UYMn621]